MNWECSPTVKPCGIVEVKSEYLIKVKIKAYYELIIQGSSAALIIAILCLRLLICKPGIKHFPYEPITVV